jgi:hypothetical protein
VCNYVFITKIFAITQELESRILDSRIPNLHDELKDNFANKRIKLNLSLI